MTEHHTEPRGNSEVKMYGALKSLDPNAAERIHEKYRDVLDESLKPDFDSSRTLDGTHADVVLENRLGHLRNELTDSIIASVHSTQRITASGR